MARQTRQEAREATLSRKAARQAKIRVTAVDWNALAKELGAGNVAVTR